MRVALSLQQARRLLVSATLLMGCLLSIAAMPAWAQTFSDPLTPRTANAGTLTLNFVNAEIDAVARAMAALSGRPVVVDPRVRGTINLLSDRPVGAAVAMEQFAAELRVRGFSLVEGDGGMYKVVPEADAKLLSGAVQVGADGARGQQVVTQVFRLRHENANNLVAVLRPLISPNNTINVSPGANALVITDYADNLRRIARIVAAMDDAGAEAADLEIRPLRHTLAGDIAPLVQRLLDGDATAGNAAGTNSALRTVVLAEPRSNALLLRASSPARLALAHTLINKLDQPPASDAAAGNIHVVYLKNAEAVRLAETLRAVMAADSGLAGSAGAGASTGGSTTRAGATPRLTSGSATSASGAGTGTGAGSATGGQIQADVPTNSLIISAPLPQYRQLRAVIDQLDMRRAQVFVESLIAEVNADVANDFGIQWQGGIPSGSSSSVVGLMGTNFGSGAGNIFNLASGISSGQPAAPGAGFTAGVGVQRGNNGVALGVLARFLETNRMGNVLSTPNLMTLDNEEAKIVIGQNVPFVTGQYTANNSSSGAVNPFQTIERRDVGLTLAVRPQISENGTVKMVISQEVSSVDPTSLTSAAGLRTSKRSIDTSVLVDDGAIIVLGGLLQDESSVSEEKVPGLGSIPGLGWLFRSESGSRKKTNLMVFLRPVIVRNTQDSNRVSLDRYDLMRAVQSQQQPARVGNGPVLNAEEAAVLPPTAPKAPVSPVQKPRDGRTDTEPDEPGAQPATQ
ncbi:type II secretion system secretin GspD [Hylemonella gracilis]|uniref:Type II and III secretion system protein n=1 Tax=Hylemonella gracilis ATCC 19624 TaxID=887062 RepID=F3KWC1_9BURK|nr:type II secretion system secretin GspD [Hylemonella gracilis]EGI75920.1 type II and III secretion system protein [Hylemonella gracilis ATCC 19624]